MSHVQRYMFEDRAVSLGLWPSPGDLLDNYAGITDIVDQTQEFGRWSPCGFLEIKLTTGSETAAGGSANGLYIFVANAVKNSAGTFIVDGNNPNSASSGPLGSPVSVTGMPIAHAARGITSKSYEIIIPVGVPAGRSIFDADQVATIASFDPPGFVSRYFSVVLFNFGTGLSIPLSTININWYPVWTLEDPGP